MPLTPRQALFHQEPSPHLPSGDSVVASAAAAVTHSTKREERGGGRGYGKRQDMKGPQQGHLPPRGPLQNSRRWRAGGGNERMEIEGEARRDRSRGSRRGWLITLSSPGFPLCFFLLHHVLPAPGLDCSLPCH